MSNTIRLGHRLDRSEIYAPGLRSVFWTQGCTLACKGCWNTQYWASRGGLEIGVSGAPETYLIDKENKIIQKHIGIVNENIWTNKFIKLIK